MGLLILKRIKTLPLRAVIFLEKACDAKFEINSPLTVLLKSYKLFFTFGKTQAK